MNREDKNLAHVFKDARMHKTIAEIIIAHLSNPVDVRKAALNGPDLSNCKKILDLGCGFGFFTQALKGRIHPKATIKGVDRHSEYKKPYIESCSEAEIKGVFDDAGVESLLKIESNTYDLILCSYALYSFPEYIPHISRILKETGKFVTITHAKPHMKEFTDYVRKVLNKHDIKLIGKLPYEELIDNFSNENGFDLLSPWFQNIKTEKHINSLVFKKKDYLDFSRYFCFKRSFFIPGNYPGADDMCDLLLDAIKQDLMRNKTLRITKDDMIFICSNPSKQGTTNV